ncbi:hypothetical protein CHU98_g2503 [Xylaria longipes]|nr:hypothetical protein CHU98_g2503 [Xylaria longipes]
MRTLSDALLSPLRSFFPRRTDTTDDLRNRDEILLPQDVILSGVAEPLPSLAWDIGRAPLDVIHAALGSLSRDMVNGALDSSLFSSFCDGWQQALADGLYQAEAIAQILTGISDGLNVYPIHADDPRIADRLKLLLMESTIEGISKRRASQATSFDHVAWNSVLHGVSAIQMNTTRVFTKAIACIPEQSLNEVSSGILGNLCAFFSAMGRVTARSTLVRQAAKMAVPLKSLRPLELRFILDDATQKVLEYADVDGVKYEDVRISWLLLLAHIPGVDEEYLARVCKALEAGMVDQRLTESEMCRLFLVWANNQAPLEQYSRIRNMLNNSRTDCYRLLGARLWETRQYHRVRHLSKLLHATGRENSIILISNFGRRGPCPLANVAIGMRRPHAAIDILCLYEESRRCKSSFWESTFGFKALEILTWIPNFNHNRLWRTLKVIPDKQVRAGRRSRRGRGRLGAVNRNEIAKIAAVGIVTGLSPHLSKRKAFSLVTNCYLNLQRHNLKLPHLFLRALVHIVTRPLADGEPGITSRLRYVLYLIQQQIGPTQARRVGLTMEGWRRSNFGLK